MLFEDMDEWSHWEELGGSREEKEKEAIARKQKEMASSEYNEKYQDAMEDLFSGDISAIQKMMQKNNK
jgi:hypothetical protein